MADLLADAVNLPRPPIKATTSGTSRCILGHHVKHAPPLVPEFSSFLEMAQPPTQPNHKCLTSHIRGEDTESRQQDLEQAVKRAKKAYRVGVQQEPQDFLEAATKIDHPMSPKNVLPEPLKVALFDNLTMDPVDLAKSRMKAVVTIKEMAKDLEKEENRIKDGCSPSVSKVLSTKRIALWETLLKASNFP